MSKAYGLTPDTPQRLQFTRPATLTSTGQVGNVAPLPAVGGSAFRTSIQPPIELNSKKKWGIVVYTASLPFTAPNIGPAGFNSQFPSGNNTFTINWNGSGAVTWTLPTGLYGLQDIASQLNVFAFNAGWIKDPVLDPLFTLQGIDATQFVNLSVNVSPASGIVIDATPASSVLTNCLGIASGTYNVPGAITSPYIIVGTGRANLFVVQSYTVNCNIAQSSYVNGAVGQAILFQPLGNAVTNSVVDVEPTFVRAVSCSTTYISFIDLWLTDQLGNVIGELNEPWSIVFALEEVR